MLSSMQSRSRALHVKSWSSSDWEWQGRHHPGTEVCALQWRMVGRVLWRSWASLGDSFGRLGNIYREGWFARVWNLTDRSPHSEQEPAGWQGDGMCQCDTPRIGCLEPSLILNLYITLCSIPLDAFHDSLPKGLGSMSHRLDLAFSDTSLEPKQLVLVLGSSPPSLDISAHWFSAPVSSWGHWEP